MRTILQHLEGQLTCPDTVSATSAPSSRPRRAAPGRAAGPRSMYAARASGRLPRDEPQPGEGGAGRGAWGGEDCSRANPLMVVAGDHD